MHIDRRGKPAALVLIAGLILGLLGSACSNGASGATGGPPSGSASDAFAAAMASTDLFAGTPQRVQVGVEKTSQTAGVKLVTFGQVGFAFSYLGADGSAAATAGPQVTASYIPAPGTAESGASPSLSDPGVARGVYGAENVTFDNAGVWQVTVTADVQGSGIENLTTAFPVSTKPALPAPGQKALKTVNLTLASKGVPASAIDSRALDGPKSAIPDKDLHQWTIAEAIAQHRPALVVFGTPVYCVSQWCGPNTDAVEALAQRYGKKAVFIHIEIWRNYTAKQHVANKAAADWLYRNGDLVDPWLYLIGADGIIKDRWAPLFDPKEVAKELAALPNMKS